MHVNTTLTFYSARNARIASAVLATAIPSVCLSVRPRDHLLTNFRPSIIIAELWRPKVARRRKKSFSRFFGKTILYENFFKILFRKDSPRHRSTCCVQILWNLADGKSVKSCVAYLPKNKISPGCPALATSRTAPKICQD